MSIKTKAIDIIERQITKPAVVLDVRPWNGNTFYEVDLHVPAADFGNNKGVPHMKCRVAPLTYRDYTISQWDADTKTCTLFIDAAHNGPGSKWVKTLQINGDFNYVNIEAHRYHAEGQSKYIFLGDQSAIGHFLAIQQLLGNSAQILGAVVVDNASHRKELAEYYPSLTVQSLGVNRSRMQTLAEWLRANPVNPNDYVCIAGNTEMVIELRHHLRKNGIAGRQIKAQGFW